MPSEGTRRQVTSVSRGTVPAGSVQDQTEWGARGVHELAGGARLGVVLLVLVAVRAGDVGGHEGGIGREEHPHTSGECSRWRRTPRCVLVQPDIGVVIIAVVWVNTPSQSRSWSRDPGCRPRRRSRRWSRHRRSPHRWRWHPPAPLVVAVLGGRDTIAVRIPAMAPNTASSSSQSSAVATPSQSTSPALDPTTASASSRSSAVTTPSQSPSATTAPSGM